MSQVLLVGFFNVAAGVSGLILRSSSVVVALSCFNLILGAGTLLCLFMIARRVKSGKRSESAA